MIGFANKSMSILLIAGLAVSGCAEMHLDKAEEAFDASAMTPASSFAEMAAFADELSDGYRKAASASATEQDVVAMLVILSAGSVAAGLAADASTRALANRAIGGVVVETYGRRFVPKTAIQGIYSGAKRLNCVATVSRIGEQQFKTAEDHGTGRAARAATYGAIQEISILTRESLVRSVPSFETVLGDITKAVGDATVDREAGVSAFTNVDTGQLNAYMKILSGCLNGSPKVSIPSG